MATAMSSSNRRMVLSKDELLNECSDLNLPVSRFDSVDVIQKHLQAAYDETGRSNFRDLSDPELEKSNIYIGKVNIFYKLKLRKFIPFL